MIKKVLSKLMKNRNQPQINSFTALHRFSIINNNLEETNNILKLKNIFNFNNIDEKIFVDIPATKPNFVFPLQKVGVTNRKHKIKIKDIFNEKENIDVEADVRIFFELPAYQRGLHMSRIEKAMQRFQDAGLEIRKYAFNLIKYAAELQNRSSGELEIEFYYEKLIDKNSSGRKAHEILQVLLFAKLLDNDKVNYRIGLSVPFMNACPCPQRWAIRDFYHKLKALNLDDQSIYQFASMINFGTHTNLGNATLIIEDLNNNITYQDLYLILDESVLITRELLSGKDEFEFIRSALIKEQFCEDAAREIVKNLVQKLKNRLDPKSFVEINVEVNESIHFHNLKVEIKDNFENILAMLKNNETNKNL